ncbi:LppM family (lipo)protein [Dermatobacter hominis]|uniref:LppM family (lipo)protein n=1 Tax=Dermatobacter hominis TaxID=2884263 RepID=UPI001D1094EB|nr:hypothetical protein [Dermatobacter hominis]UDY37955.1 hypothetical protein LH044_10510 [Dermatobacter hominis]
MQRRRGTRSWWAVAATALIVLLATGCLRADVNVHVDDDRSGSVELDLYFSEESLRLAGLNPDDLKDLAETATASQEGIDISTIAADGERGIRMTIEFDDYRQLASALTEGDVQGRTLRLFQSFEISEGPEGKWSLQAEVDPGGFDAVLNEIPASFPTEDLDPDDVEVNFSVTLPGEVARTNATSSDGGTATWVLAGSDAATTLTLENEPSSVSPLQWAMIGIAALIVIGLILLLVTAAGGRRRRRRGAARHSLETSAPQGWAPTAPPPIPVGPDGWSSPPPYSSHGWGDAAPSTPAPPTAAGTPAPTAPPVGTAPLGGTQTEDLLAAALAASSGMTAEQPTAPNPSPAGPAAPIGGVATPPTTPIGPDAGAPADPGPAGWAPPVGPPIDPDRVGPPVLPAGFVPRPDVPFPETHSYGQATEPVVPAPYAPTAAPTGPPPSGDPGRLGPPTLPDGFVPTPPGAFPDTHGGGPPPTDRPPPFTGSPAPPTGADPAAGPDDDEASDDGPG